MPSQPAWFHRLDEILSDLRSMTLLCFSSRLYAELSSVYGGPASRAVALLRSRELTPLKRTLLPRAVRVYLNQVDTPLKYNRSTMPNLVDFSLGNTAFGSGSMLISQLERGASRW